MSTHSEFDLWKVFCAVEEHSVVRTDPWARVLFKDRSTWQVDRPVVSEVLFKNGFQPHYPGDRPFAVCLSHDVDHLLQDYLSLTDRLKEIWREFFEGRIKRALKYFDRDGLINPNYNIEKLLEIEDRLGIKSTFYFMSLRSGEQDYNYSLDQIHDVLHSVQSANCEIGLHGGHTAFVNVEKLAEEKDELERISGAPITGYRNHFLKLKVPDTWNNLVSCGFKYDTTYGFPDHPGFRNGMCYPFFPYDLRTGLYSQILEIPLLVMDATFIYYLKSDKDKAFALIRDTIDKARKVNGVFTLLWHNNYLYNPWKDLFQSIVSYCIDSGAWFATGNQLNDWWRKNRFCEAYADYGLQNMAER